MTSCDSPINALGLYMDSMARTTAMRSIFVTGSVRTGTTAMAQFLHSLQGAEYLHEPQLPNVLLPAIHSFTPDIWQLLFQSYLHEEGLLEAISGRRMNLNRHDQSSIWHCKTAREIRQRLDHSVRRVEARKKAESHRLVFKIPDMMPYFEPLTSYYPEMTIIVMVRKPDSIMLSAMEKGWYRDITSDRSQGVFPWKSPGKPYLPFWLNDEDLDRWETISEMERACLHYITVHKALLNMISLANVLLVDYDMVSQNSEAYLTALSRHIGMEFGEKSASLIKNFKESPKPRSFDYSQVPEMAKDEIFALADQIQDASEQQWAQLANHDT